MAGEPVLVIGSDRFDITATLRHAGFALVDRLSDAAAAVLIEEARDPPLASLPSEHRLPLLLLSSRTSVADRVRALDDGADDWLGVPFAGEELAARLRALLRRTARLRCGELSIDLAGRSASRAGVMLELRPRELALLAHLVRHSERVVARDELLAAVWGRAFDPGTNSVAVHVSRLRDKLDRGFPTAMLHTVGSGYLLSARVGIGRPAPPADLRRTARRRAREDVIIA